MTQAARNRMTLRTADPSEARKLYALIQANLDEGHLLPRTCSELATHATRFVVAVRGPRIVGCAELASLSPQVAEVRSLAVDRDARGQGIGVTIVDELRRRALVGTKRANGIGQSGANSVDRQRHADDAG